MRVEGLTSIWNLSKASSHSSYPIGSSLYAMSASGW
jgi:hypothetical protein